MMSETGDEYQERYLRHQVRKGRELAELMELRYSERRFSDRQVGYEEIEEVAQVCAAAPSSCDRHGVRVKAETERDRKDLLAGLLVGGAGWLHRAPAVMMLWADVEAYKAGEEVKWNAYLDAGCMMMAMLLHVTELGMASAVCNPQVRPANLAFFEERFRPRAMKRAAFCGAVAIGWAHEKVERPPRDRKVEMLVR